MAMITSVNTNGIQPRIFHTSHGAQVKPAPLYNVALHQDSVRISDHARMMNRIADLPPSRLEKIERVRAQIAAGRYETDDKFDVAIERMAGDLSSGA